MRPDSSNGDFDDELLSAYVDDELTPQERAQVEERLRRDPRAVQMVEELRSLSRAIKSLPRETLGRDLRAIIQAEADVAKAEADDKSVLPLTPPYDRWAGYRRGLAWSLVAIAATLVLMVAMPREANRDGDEVAQVDRQRQLGREQTGDIADAPLPPRGEMRALGKPVGALEESLPADGEIDAMSAVKPPAAPAASSPGPESGVAADSSLRRDQDRPLDEAKLAAKAEGPTATSETPMSLSAELAQGQAAGAAVGGAAAGGGAATTAAAGVEAGSVVALNKSAEPKTIELLLKTEEGGPRFKQVLLDNQIAVGPPPPTELGDAYDFAFGAVQQYRMRGLAENRRSEASGTRASDSTSATKEAEAMPEEALPAEAVMVEARPEQIEQVLKTLRADKAFGNVQLSERKLDAGLGGGEIAEQEGRERGGEANQLADDRFGGGEGVAPRYAAEPALGTRVTTKEQLALDAFNSKDKAAEPSAGRAWFLSWNFRQNEKLERFADEAQAKKDAVAQRSADTKAVTDFSAAGSRPAAVGGAGPTQPQPEREVLAKQAAPQPAAGQIRVMFLLRQAKPPATAAPAKAAK